MISMSTSDGYYLITGEQCNNIILCSKCEDYKSYKKERRYGSNEHD